MRMTDTLGTFIYRDRDLHIGPDECFKLICICCLTVANKMQPCAFNSLLSKEKWLSRFSSLEFRPSALRE